MSEAENVEVILRQRFEALTVKAGPDDCWEWLGAKTDKGHGIAP